MEIHMMNSDQHFDSPTSLSFEKKISFSASQDLASIRSKGFVRLEKAHEMDAWELKAPDFTPKLYSSLHPLRKKKENRRPALFSPSSRETLFEVKRGTQIVLPEIHQSREPPAFTLSYRPPDALQTKLIFVKKGKYPCVAYSDPKPHDFRQYTDVMPDMVTALKKDPGNVNFKSQHLSTIGGTRPREDFHQRATTRRFDTFKPAEPKWDSQLILPRKPWPPKSASYTRHRRMRGVYSAFLDRVEEKLSSSWKMSDLATSC
ncbi:hypothetical protein AGOR_G00210740 [Albula goreensis]|uniref:Uncharacterized protein n=1 Tax=Albula goreensis TaxID=1534307 RepID=A0A8T3CQQ7_9TELE|nr:hypothetical protein AGOR_G00210740 [Albula goreensis]